MSRVEKGQIKKKVEHKYDRDKKVATQRVAVRLAKVFGLSVKKTAVLALMLSGYIWTWIIKPFLEYSATRAVRTSGELVMLGTDTTRLLIGEMLNLVRDNPVRFASCAALMASDGTTESLIRDFKRIADEIGSSTVKSLDKLSYQLTTDLWDDIVTPNVQKLLPSTVNVTSQALVVHDPLTNHEIKSLVFKNQFDSSAQLSTLGKIRILDLPIPEAPIAPSQLQRAAQLAACNIMERTGYYPTLNIQRECLDMTSSASIRTRCPRIYEDLEISTNRVINDVMYRGVAAINHGLQDIQREYGRTRMDLILVGQITGAFLLIFIMFYFLYGIVIKGVFKKKQIRNRS